MKLKDIAEMTGVSMSTVSRVLNDPYSTAAGPEKKKEIWEIVQKSGYIPNREAKILKSGASVNSGKVICCMLATETEEYQNDPFYSTLVSAIRTEGLKQGYTVEYYFHDRPEKSTRDPEKAEGLIIIGRFNPEILKSLGCVFKNIIYVGLNRIEARCDRIICDGGEAVAGLVRTLYDSGHRKIAYIGVGSDTRLDGFLSGCRSCGISPERSAFIRGRALTANLGYDMMNRVAETGGFTAVICGNDITAIGALKTCSERKIRVPEDISLVGMDDIEMTRYVTPALSTIHVPMDEMASMAVKLIRDRAEGGHSNHVEIRFPYWLVKRGSGPNG